MWSYRWRLLSPSPRTPLLARVLFQNLWVGRHVAMVGWSRLESGAYLIDVTTVPWKGWARVRTGGGWEILHWEWVRLYDTASSLDHLGLLWAWAVHVWMVLCGHQVPRG